MTPQTYIGTRYVSFNGPIVSGFYGEDPDGKEEEWQFIVYKRDKEVFRRSNSQLIDSAGNDSPEAMLIAGLIQYLNK